MQLKHISILLPFLVSTLAAPVLEQNEDKLGF